MKYVNIKLFNHKIYLAISINKTPGKCKTCGKQLKSNRATHCPQHRQSGICVICNKILVTKGNYCRKHKKLYKPPETTRNH